MLGGRERSLLAPEISPLAHETRDESASVYTEGVGDTAPGKHGSVGDTPERAKP